MNKSCTTGILDQERQANYHATLFCCSFRITQQDGVQWHIEYPDVLTISINPHVYID